MMRRRIAATMAAVAGIGYALNDRAGVQLDYRRLEFSDLPLHSVGVLFSYRFGG